MSRAADYSSLANGVASSDFLVPTAFIQRVNDRLFVGGATDNDGAWPNIGRDWLTTFEMTAGGRASGAIVPAQMAVLTNNYSNAATALVTGARTSNFTSVSAATGHVNIVVNDHTTLQVNAWGGYTECHRTNDVTGQMIAHEFDVRNSGAYYAVTPSNQHAKMTGCLQIAAGAEYPAGGQADTSFGINLRDNPTKFGVGIVFGANAIRGTDGVTGYGNAMLFGLRQKMAWMNSADQVTAEIWAETTSTANKMGIAFASTGTFILGPSSTTVALFRPVASAANYLDVWAATTGSPVELRATGSDPNIDIKLIGAGTGKVRFGTFTANADAPVTGYITIADAGGTARKLAIIA